jgi:hypothetical protein
MRIIHPGDNAQVQGFQVLFLLLDTNPAADELRRMVVDYFNDSPPLQAHLSEHDYYCLNKTQYLPDSFTLNPVEHPGAAPLPFFETYPYDLREFQT